MKLQSLLLKFSIFIFTILIFETDVKAQAQVNISHSKKDPSYIEETTNVVVRGMRINATQLVVQEKVNTELISRPKNGTGSRKCAPKNTSNPFAISRENFNKLPADRQLFILENTLIYTIVD